MEPNMLNKRPAEGHWSHRLEEINSLAALLLEDKTAAWEKLHNRLQQKPKRTLRAWYWAAAAVVLLICSLPLFFSNNKQVNPKHDLVKNTAAKTMAPILTGSEKKNVITAQPILPQKIKLPPVVRHMANGKNFKIDNQPIELVAASPELVVHKETKQPMAAIAPIENELKAPMLAVTVLAKPTLRVVHINELGEVVPQRNKAMPADDGFVKFKIINQQYYTGTAVTAKAIGFSISKSSSPN